jgi:hypothetical protein
MSETLNAALLENYIGIPAPGGYVAPLGCDALFAVNDWQQIGETPLKAYYDVLAHLSAEAFHFVLPAYLRYALNNWGSQVWEFTLYSLTPGKGKDGDAEWWRDRFRLFTPGQKSVLYEFLDLVIADPQAYGSHTIAERGKARLQRYLDSV